VPDAPTLLPRPVHRDSRAAAAASQHDRMLVAMAESAAERGYAGATVADAIARAGVSRRTFYEHFADKEACFLEAYDRGVRTMAAEVGTRALAEGDWRDQVRTMCEVFLGLLAAEPVFARIALVEIWAAGPMGLERYRQTIDRFHAALVELDRRAREQDPGAGASDLAIEALAGGINRIATARVLAGRAEDLPALAGELAEHAIATIEGPS
jgi:AcrR family transcriptional regulator